MIKYVGNRVEQLGMLPQVSECHLSRLTVEFVLVYEWYSWWSGLGEGVPTWSHEARRMVLFTGSLGLCFWVTCCPWIAHYRNLVFKSATRMSVHLRCLCFLNASHLVHKTANQVSHGSMMFTRVFGGKLSSGVDITFSWDSELITLRNVATLHQKWRNGVNPKDYFQPHLMGSQSWHPKLWGVPYCWWKNTWLTSWYGSFSHCWSGF